MPRCVSDRVNETGVMKLVDFLFNHFYLRGVELTLLLPNEVGINPCVNVVLHDYRTNSWNF